MSEVPGAITSAAAPEGGSSTHFISVPASAVPPENHPTPTNTAVAGEAPRLKLRSCVTCRTRKVRCDKGSPCSNCRRAKIPCVVPSLDKPPRWARRLERVANSAKAEQDADNARAGQGANAGVNQVMERLRSLESLVKELSSELEQARAAASAGASTAGHSPESSNQDADHHETSAPDVSNVQEQFGRLVLGHSSRSRYVSSGFWSRVHDEVGRLVNLAHLELSR